jgi:pimeloyl-ACP methyl ester carboxylesterase
MPTHLPGETIHLPDGRVLGFAQYGAPDGVPLFFFHGLGASRLSRHPDEQIARTLGVRVITIDRPGIGLSAPHPGRTLLDWPADVRALANALQFERFAVLGWSGGGPYALACAYAMPERLLAVGLVSGSAPLVGPESTSYLTRQWRLAGRLARTLPWFVRLFAWQQERQIRRLPERFVQSIIERYPHCDREVLSGPYMHQMMMDTTLEHYRQGYRGLSDDMLVLARPWGFRLEDITIPVWLWHGEEDTILELPIGHYLKRALPQCQAAFYPREGHFLLLTHWEELLRTLTMRSVARAAH